MFRGLALINQAKKISPAIAIVKALLKSLFMAIAMRGDRPNEKAIGQVIARFMEAVRQRDATGAMLLATPELAGKLPREILPVEFQYRVLSTRIIRPQPRVVVWVQVADLSAGQNVQKNE